MAQLAPLAGTGYNSLSMPFALCPACGKLTKKALTGPVPTAKHHPQEYKAWASMLNRCFNSNTEDWHRYGGRGITVCPQWMNFIQFYKDVGPKPEKGYSLDRYPNRDGNYEPGNVRWATIRQQNRNTAFNRLSTMNGITRCTAEWAEIYGVDVNLLHSRLRRGFTIEEALFTPVIPRNHKLTPDDVREIRRLKRKGGTEAGIAEQFNITRTLVGKIARRENWKHIPD